MLKFGLLVLGLCLLPSCVDDNCTIDPACTCPSQYDPVCGSNGKTYGNGCIATCSGITDYVEGECL